MYLCFLYLGLLEMGVAEQERGQLGSSFCVSAFIKVYKLRFHWLAPVET
jgi:hypothetical protein